MTIEAESLEQALFEDGVREQPALMPTVLDLEALRAMVSTDCLSPQLWRCFAELCGAKDQDGASEVLEAYNTSTATSNNSNSQNKRTSTQRDNKPAGSPWGPARRSQRREQVCLGVHVCLSIVQTFHIVLFPHSFCQDSLRVYMHRCVCLWLWINGRPS